MTFILAEKPGVAAAFAAALGVPGRGGFYEDERFTITNCIGHLLSLYDAADYDEKYKKWNLADLPLVPQAFLHKPSEKTARQLKLVEGLLKKPYESYVIATDAGREGELIARLVFEYAGVSDFGKVRRFWTSSALTKEVISSCMQACKPAAEYDGLFYSGLYRQLSDWLVGINFSRLFSVAFNGKFIFGRVQTPVLNMIVHRENDIANFKKSFFYRLEVPSRAGTTDFTSCLVDENGEKNFDDKEALGRLVPGVPGTSLVTDVSKEKKTVFPPRLFDLTELQKTANTKFGYTAQKTLELAQSLYEKHKCLSYPRTSSRYISRVNYDLFVQCLDSLGISHGVIDVNNKNIFNDEAMEKNREDHHALLLLAKLPEGANNDEQNIYGLVFSNMENVIKPPFVYEKITVRHSKDSLFFTASGRNVIDPGFKTAGAADEEQDEEKDEEERQALPDLDRGDEITLGSPEITCHERKPPKSFTEAMLLSAMKKYELGTVATRDSVIEGLVKNEYIFRNGKKLLPSDKARFFIASILSLGHAGIEKYLDVSNTGDWEAMLENEPGKFFAGIKDFVASSIKELKLKSFTAFMRDIGICPKCGGAVVPGKFSYYCSNRKEKECSFSIGKTICEAAVTEADMKTLLSGKKTGLKSMKSKAGKDFKAYLKLDGDFNIQFEFKDSKETKGGKK